MCVSSLMKSSPSPRADNPPMLGFLALCLLHVWDLGSRTSTGKAPEAGNLRHVLGR